MDKEYIDREWLIEHFDTIRQNMIMRQVDKYPAACVFAIKEIKDFPAADVVEVRHGRWVWDETATDWGLGGWVCSECQAKNDNIPEKPNTNPTIWRGSHYCSNCGAKMDKKELKS